MKLLSTIWFSVMPDIMVWPENILVIALVSKIQDGPQICKVKLYKLQLFSTERTYNCQQKGSRFVIFVTTISQGKLSDFLTKLKTNSLPKMYLPLHSIGSQLTSGNLFMLNSHTRFFYRAKCKIAEIGNEKNRDQTYFVMAC